MLRILTLAATLTLSGLAHADPIEGNWKTKSGATAQISDCGSSFCITLKSGQYSGKRIGTFNADGGGSYSGKITDPAKDKAYTGKATLSGSSLKMGGCVLGGLICRNETWTRL